MMKRMTITDVEVLSLDPDVGDHKVASITIDVGRIAAITPGAGAPPDPGAVIDGSGLLALPGFVDTHRHTWQSAIKHSYAEFDPGVYFAEVLTRIGAAYDPEDVYLGNLLGSYASLSCGTTTLFDWSHVQNSPEHSDAAIRGLREAGVRAVFGHGWPTSTDLRWVEPNSPYRHPADISRVHRQYFADGPLDDRISLALAARGPEMASERVWREELEIARNLGIRVSVHVGAYDTHRHSAAVSHYAAAGVLASDMTFVHCNHVSHDEFAAIVKAGGSISFGPHCELNSQGVGDIPLLRVLDAGLRPTLSGDTETKCSGDMFTQMRMLWGYYRSTLGRMGPAGAAAPRITLRDILEFATIDGARALGLEDEIGTLTPGKRADIVLIGAQDLNLAPMQDPVSSIVLAAHEGNVQHVIVGGVFVKWEGKLANVDTHELVARAAASQRGILGRASR